MKGEEVCSLILKIPDIDDSFWGVIPAEGLQYITNEHTMIYIVNTQESSSPGQHWVVVNVNDTGSIELFDSQGLNPEKYGPFFKDFLKRTHCNWINTKLQPSHSDKCALYCLTYIYFKHIYGLDLRCIVKYIFFNNMKNNELFVSAVKNYI